MRNLAKLAFIAFMTVQAGASADCQANDGASAQQFAAQQFAAQPAAQHAAAQPAGHAASTQDPVRIEGGLISGTVNSTGDIRIFRGIPFAAPPVGPLRWKAPQPAKPWKGIRACDRFGPSPMQNKPAPFSMWSQEFLIPKEPISEDCLYLNVWTGASTGSGNNPSAGASQRSSAGSAQNPPAGSEKRPVLVWIYGGGFVSGGSAVPIYDGEAMAKKGIVFVSINYRVGIFGFFAHPELTRESGRHASGNYGLMDQVEALKWVKKNIAAFGGDPGNITIAGQSAGSMSVNALMASPLTKGLFEKAIGESGASFTLGNPHLKAAEDDGEKTLESFQLKSIAQLRAVPAEELMKKAPGIRGPIIDGYVLPDDIRDLYFNSMRERKLRLLTGWNEDEGLLFGPMKKAVDFQYDLKLRYGPSADTLLQFYPAATDSEASVSQLRLSRDMIFGVQNFWWAMMTLPFSKVYLYRFTRKPPATGEYVKYGAFHTAEVPYAYDNLQFVDRPWQPIDRQLAARMSSYWANFVKTGDPNGPGLPLWESYDLSDPGLMMMVLDENPRSVELPDGKALDFLWGIMTREALAKEAP